MNPKSILEKNLKNSIKAKQDFLENPPILEEFNDAIEALFECYSNGGKLYLAGNGGSAADSQHLAAEFVSKLAFDREALPAEALSVDTSTITAIANEACIVFDKDESKFPITNFILNLNDMTIFFI